MYYLAGVPHSPVPQLCSSLWHKVMRSDTRDPLPHPPHITNVSLRLKFYPASYIHGSWCPRWVVKWIHKIPKLTLWLYEELRCYLPPPSRMLHPLSALATVKLQKYYKYWKPVKSKGNKSVTTLMWNCKLGVFHTFYHSQLILASMADLLWCKGFRQLSISYLHIS